MQLLVVPHTEVVPFDVEEFIGLFARTLDVLALCVVQVYHTYHDNSILLTDISAVGKVRHLLNLDQCI